MNLGWINAPVKWTVEASVTKLPISLLVIWTSLGYVLIVYMAALQNVPRTLYEAATIDGAGRWAKLWHITIPGILGTIMITLIMRIGRMLTLGYDKIILLYNDMTLETADVIPEIVLGIFL